jgi:hypothetical protein
MATIRISAGPVRAIAELADTSTAQAILDTLPITGSASTWGDEIYFAIPVDADEDDARAVVDVGDLAYWPPGSAFCIFFGPTPASQGSEIRPASPVNVVGRIEGDATIFRQVRDGTPVLIELETSDDRGDDPVRG